MFDAKEVGFSSSKESSPIKVHTYKKTEIIKFPSSNESSPLRKKIKSDSSSNQPFID